MLSKIKILLKTQQNSERMAAGEGEGGGEDACEHLVVRKVVFHKSCVVNGLTRPSGPTSGSDLPGSFQVFGRSCLAVGHGLLDFHSRQGRL